MNERKLIGLVGYAGAGKDAAAEALVAQGWQRVAFADPLRKMLLAIDPYIPAQVSSSARVSGFVAAMGWAKAKQHPEVRRLLQAIGTEAVRNIIGPNTWTDLARKSICESTNSIVVTDVRFANEADMLRSMGGLLIRITREGVGPVNGHVSDNLVESLECNGEIANDGTLEELHEMIVEMAERVPASQFLARYKYLEENHAT